MVATELALVAHPYAGNMVAIYGHRKANGEKEL
jgi:hypothetical protein